MTELRLKGIRAELDHMDRSVKAQFKYADKTGVKYVAVVGEDELKNKTVNIKNMSDGTQETVNISEVYSYLVQKENL